MKDKLSQAIDEIQAWQHEQDRQGKSRNGRCLETVRYALREVGLSLPLSGVDYPGMFAQDCGKRLLLDPARWGWKQIHHPLPRYSLVFFKRCGFVKRRLKFAGHIAVLDSENNILYANRSDPYSNYFRARIFAAFVPK